MPPLRPADIPPEVVSELNAGRRRTANLAELLAMDLAALVSSLEPALAHEANARIDRGAGVTRRMHAAAALLVERLGPGCIDRLAAHGSDTVRGWACYAIGLLPGLTLSQRYARVRKLADDEHFGVREWAWLALRPHVAADSRGAVSLGVGLVRSKSERLRRFAVEATRPRGVWATHLTELVRDPSPGLALLEPVRADPSGYVQDSVANWLNDAAKSRPDWVRLLVERWRAEGDGAATAYITRRALRSLRG